MFALLKAYVRIGYCGIVDLYTALFYQPDSLSGPLCKAGVFHDLRKPGGIWGTVMSNLYKGQFAVAYFFSSKTA